jgi:peptidoglycan/xylan/chitin deacetylase (PgdA/CDA1 family)
VPLSLRSVLALSASALLGTWLSLGAPRTLPAFPSLPSFSKAKSTVASSVPDPLPVPSPELPDKHPWPRLNPEADLGKAWLLAEGPHHERKDARRVVTLTFDDGPYPETTPKVLELLRKYDVRATFFVVGRYLLGESERAKRSREVLKEVAEAGHLIGNHTQGHALLTQLTPEQIGAEIDLAARGIEMVTGKRPLLFRPPYGQLDSAGMAAARARGLDLVLWSVEAHDMERSDTRQMLISMKTQLDFSRGGIVLLHDVRHSSVKLLEQLLVALRAAPFDPSRPDRVGYEIVDLPTYFRETEAKPQPYETREALQRDRMELWEKKHPKKPAPLVGPELKNVRFTEASP